MGLHAAVIAGLLSVKDATLELPPPPEAIMVSLVEAPVPQQAKADEPTPEVPPPPVEQPPPPPEPETKPDPTPDPTPEVEPDPEPEPVIEKPPEPAKPKPKPKPKPQPKPQPVKPKPVETPPPAPPPPPTGTPEGSNTPQAPRQGPPQDQPELVSSIAYDGSGPQAVYPMASQRLREEGRVMVLLLVSPQGTVEKVTVITSSGYSRLDQAALDAFRRVHFKPYTRNGVALPAQVKIPFDFKIRN